MWKCSSGCDLRTANISRNRRDSLVVWCHRAYLFQIATSSSVPGEMTVCCLLRVPYDGTARDAKQKRKRNMMGSARTLAYVASRSFPLISPTYGFEDSRCCAVGVNAPCDTCCEAPADAAMDILLWCLLPLTHHLCARRQNIPIISPFATTLRRLRLSEPVGEILRSSASFWIGGAGTCSTYKLD